MKYLFIGLLMLVANACVIAQEYNGEPFTFNHCEISTSGEIDVITNRLKGIEVRVGTVISGQVFSDIHPAEYEVIQLSLTSYDTTESPLVIELSLINTKHTMIYLDSKNKKTKYLVSWVFPDGSTMLIICWVSNNQVIQIDRIKFGDNDDYTEIANLKSIPTSPNQLNIKRL